MINVKVIAITLFQFVNLATSQNLTFTNPIIGGYSGNPSILKLREFYYLTLQNHDNTKLVIFKSPILTNFRNVEVRKVAVNAPDGFTALEQSEMVEVNGGLYLYFHMRGKVGSISLSNGYSTDALFVYKGLQRLMLKVGRRLFVTKANNPTDPMGGWGEPIRLLHDWGHSAIDGTVMKHNNQLYFVWTKASSNYSLYIAPMTSPTWVGNPKVLLREPQESWECGSRCYIAGPSFIYSKNVSYLIYSANAWSSADYCLGQMSIPEGSDPLTPDNWKTVKEPVFWMNDDEDVYSTGVAEFTTSLDGTETWMVYHAAISPTHIRYRQTARLEKIEWNDDGSPTFPRPLGIHNVKFLPSGQTATCTCISSEQNQHAKLDIPTRFDFHSNESLT